MTILSTFVTCATMFVGMQGASVKSWDDVEIVMDGSGDKVVNSVDLFGLAVTSGGENWTTEHRYNDFVALKTKLGPEADAIAVAPFPGKHWWPWMTDSMKAERRKALEKWIQQVATRAAKVIDAWKEHVNEFLKQGSEVGVYGKDQWMQLLSSVNEKTQSKWATTASNLQKWYDNGVANCERDDNCKAFTSKLTDMKSGVAEMAKNIWTKTEEMKERIKEAMALNNEVDQAKVDFEKMKDSGRSNAEEIKAAEDKLSKAEEKASKKMKEVESLKQDVRELEQNAETTMEKSFEHVVVSTEL